MSRVFVPIAVIVLFFAVSCTNFGRSRDTPPLEVELDLPPVREAPALRILDYENMAENAAMRPWLRSYLANGLAALESGRTYAGSYLFISSISAPERLVVERWLANYSLERDFSRLAAARIQDRFHRGLSVPPDILYGPNYEKAVKDAYRYAFWGAERLDDTWVYAASPTGATPAEQPRFWGFILLRVPRETLEIQVSALLSEIEDTATGGGRPAAREQNDAFDDVKRRFFEQF